MLLEALYHVPRDKWAYAYDPATIHLRIRTKRDDVERVFALTGDKYDWKGTYQELAMEKAAHDRMFDYWEVSVRPRFKRLSYAFKLVAGAETVYMQDSGIQTEEPTPPGELFEFPYIHEIEVFKVPEWAKQAVFYQIMPERFANGDPSNDPKPVEAWGGKPTRENYFGGDLQGVLDHLDDLVDLGITAIYFTPLFAAPSNHKYDTMDYKKVDPHFGDNALLKKVVECCHERGIRVVLDAVFNHCGEQFPPFQDVLKNGAASPYADWFHVNQFPARVENGFPTYDTFGFFPKMPKFNTANPRLKEYLLGVAEYWIKEIKLDGWRLDVANEIDHHFWREFRQVVKKANPDAYLIGEVWSDSLNWLLGDQFDSVMNYPFADKVLEFFNGGMDGCAFSDEMGALIMRYPQQTNEVVFNMLCSHDTPRLLTRVGGDKRKLKLCVVFLFTYIGTPCVFYGDEIGLTGEGDPDCRKCMEWDRSKQDRELYDFYKLMIALRKKHIALRQGRFRFLHAEHGDPCIIYERMDELMHFTVWMNNTPEPRTLTHPMQTSDWRDGLTEEPVAPAGGVMNVSLDPYGFRILYRRLK
ncbi:MULTISPECIES: alpha-glycosidase [Paenibacillus]|uniref:Cyclomaltodextrinase n=1 Tax=Paenibacillus macerans TaxID=44252 RepID=A0A090ZEU2_PAEMA|nr:alpha-glycosidase [Paenibacillus macerans]KFN08745.1 cyclomaltodextrinase [Paenibacillus macerans]MBS5912206.1 alpha-glycosidase [Paenibacillus macerans]MCY7562116.1 alpha-glycosidase [Paenibacillus macerans]MEC0155125.1 alpha-glycosidase [Paenibacillus macerans]SUA83391.1 alpha amylase catalytic subunit [Paenibacillus macerans]